MSWLKAKDEQSGVEYSSLFHSGLRAISLHSQTRRSSIAVPSSSLYHEKISDRSRPSAASLSSHLFHRRRKGSQSPETPRESHPPSSPVEGKVMRPLPSSMSVHSTKEIPEPWSSGGAFEIQGRQKVSEYHQDTNYVPVIPPVTYPFAWLPRSRSFFVNFRNIDTHPIPPKDVSFLFL
jgi:hypothetical protein